MADRPLATQAFTTALTNQPNTPVEGLGSLADANLHIGRHDGESFSADLARRRHHLARHRVLCLHHGRRVAFTTTGTFATGTSISVWYQPA